MGVVFKCGDCGNLHGAHVTTCGMCGSANVALLQDEHGPQQSRALASIAGEREAEFTDAAIDLLRSMARWFKQATPPETNPELRNESWPG
jgi:hypothetical protein